MKHLFCDCKTDKEKANFFLSGRAVETGIVASAISNDVAMAYHRCAEFQKEIDALRAKIERMEKMQDALRRHHEMAMGAGLDPSHSLTKLRVSAYQQTCLYADTVAALEE